MLKLKVKRIFLLSFAYSKYINTLEPDGKPNGLEAFADFSS
jgi:hypothetical protein